MKQEKKSCKQCGKMFQARHPAQKFCTHKGAGNCKDRFHNLADPSRLARVGIMPRDDINWDTVEDDTHPFSSEALGQD